MPSESKLFTPSSILFRPHHKPPHESGSSQRFVVEAPGTAPGSDGFITTAIYRHSCLSSTSNIGIGGLNAKLRGWRGEPGS
jgi:hypothetical protein